MLFAMEKIIPGNVSSLSRWGANTGEPHGHRPHLTWLTSSTRDTEQEILVQFASCYDGQHRAHSPNWRVGRSGFLEEMLSWADGFIKLLEGARKWGR